MSTFDTYILRKINYKGNFKKQNITYSGSNINAICFSSRNNKLIYCRIYKINNAKATTLVPMISGFITSYSANKKITDINSVLLALEVETKKYFKAKNTTFSEVVNQKNISERRFLDE